MNERRLQNESPFAHNKDTKRERNHTVVVDIECSERGLFAREMDQRDAVEVGDVKKIGFIKMPLCILLCALGLMTGVTGCGSAKDRDTGSDRQQTEAALTGQKGETEKPVKKSTNTNQVYTKDTAISQVMKDPDLGTYGRLLFPVNRGYSSGSTLGSLRLTWYSNMDLEKTVEIANYVKAQAQAGETVFYNIYSDREKAEDPEKENTGLFFFRGKPGAKFAICNAGGGFAYVGAMQDSFPHALELSKLGYNAFALNCKLEAYEGANGPHESAGD